MGNIGTVATIVFIMVLFLGGLSIIGTDILKNNNLDNDSIKLVSDLGSEYTNNYNVNDSFITQTQNLTANSTLLGSDAFTRQFFENKQEQKRTTSTTDKILNIPTTFITMFGVTNESLIILWKTAFFTFLAFLLGLYAYKFVRTGEVD